MKSTHLDDAPKVVFHAPTRDSLRRARNNAVNFLRQEPAAEIRIIVNAEAVGLALDEAHPETDAITWLCPNTFAALDRPNRPPLRLLDGPAVVEIARWQQVGWLYIHS